MKILQAAQNILISRAVDLYIDMRDGVELSDYHDHFGTMGEVIAKIESYQNFGDICNAIEQGQFEVLCLFEDDEPLDPFLYDVKNYMEKYSK